MEREVESSHSVEYKLISEETVNNRFSALGNAAFKLRDVLETEFNDLSKKGWRFHNTTTILGYTYLVFVRSNTNDVRETL